MEPITTAIIAALSAGAATGLTEASKTAITDAYQRLKELLSKKFGASSEVVQAVNAVEVRPDSAGRQATLQEEIIAVHADQDADIQAATNSLLSLVQSQQAGPGKFIIQNNATVQGQNIGDHNTNTQHFGERP